MLGYGLFCPAPYPYVMVIGKVEPKDVKKIQATVRRHLWSARVEHVWPMLLHGNFKQIPSQVRWDARDRMNRIADLGDGSAMACISGGGTDHGYLLLLNHTNGWRIYGTLPAL